MRNEKECCKLTDNEDNRVKTVNLTVARRGAH